MRAETVLQLKTLQLSEFLFWILTGVQSIGWRGGEWGGGEEPSYLGTPLTDSVGGGGAIGNSEEFFKTLVN